MAARRSKPKLLATSVNKGQKKTVSNSELLLEVAKSQGHGGEVRIAKMRAALSSLLEPEDFDSALIELHEANKVKLYRDDNPFTAERSGYFDLNGFPRHILYVVGFVG